ncbi:hypothetical protein GB931_18095 [Modestobacter sp. I12A-02628]|uniref:Uncharacterized protein n=1 Tax=Goekera deserti TaxID=2497753 RepID=A0A7K3W7X5_9ACTN|nr:hypothetical protein [Goekera deserti]MPQ99793.1 hypothetical protein [Goekera deserti]NDI49950.1 hypothetical protein [Goekera deserti]NEL52572.1 hypothetical protein [Goekera deserti]
MRTSRTWWLAAAVAVAVLVAGLAGWALQTHEHRATASLTVTPRTDAGADATRLVADRYGTLAGSVATARGALALLGDDAPDVTAGELTQDVEVDRPAGGSTIAVTVTLPGRDDAVATANALVTTLVEQGADEEVVAVEVAAEAVPESATATPDAGVWAVSTVLVALALGLAAVLLTPSGATRPRATEPAPVPVEPPAPEPATELHDDLPAFRDHPPGSPVAGGSAGATAPRGGVASASGSLLPGGVHTASQPLPPSGALPASGALPTSGSLPPSQVLSTSDAAPADRPGEPAPGRGGSTARPGPRHAVTRAGLGTALVVTGLVLAGTAVTTAALVRDDDAARAQQDEPRGEPAGDGRAAEPRAADRPGSGAGAASPSAAELVPVAAGALAGVSVPVGTAGRVARAVFGGVVLERRPVGVTVTYPLLSVSSDGERALAHLQLPTYNCFGNAAPADPVAGGCARSTPEYADAAADVALAGDRLTVAAVLPTYTRPAGQPPQYTGRSYEVSASLQATVELAPGMAAATGELRLGAESAGTVPDGLNVLLGPG